jgi:hypothetical protein
VSVDGECFAVQGTSSWKIGAQGGDVGQVRQVDRGDGQAVLSLVDRQRRLERPARAVEVAEGPSGDLEWIPVENSSADGLDRIGGLGRKLWDGLWAGELKLPYDRGSRPMRLVVREFEVLLGDSDAPSGGTDSFIAAPSTQKPGYSSGTELRRRLVYADVIEI